MIWSIAWRNVWRNKLRSLVIIIAITIGLIGGIMYYAIMNGMVEQRVNSAIDNEISNIQIHHPGFLLNEEIQYTIDQPQNLIAEIEKIEGVKAASSRIKASAMISTAETGTGVMINGIEPEKEKLVTGLSDKMLDGNYITDKDRIPILVGDKLAKKLNAKIGSKVVITIANTDGIITYGAFRIVGIYNTDNDMYDELYVFVRQNDLCQLIGFEPEKSSEIAIRLSENITTDQIADVIRAKYSDQIGSGILSVRTWKQIEPTLFAMIDMLDLFLYFFLVIILAALAFGIVNTMLMVVMERIKEIGMLMAIGLNKKRIFSMIMLETVFLSIVGGIVGIIISIALVQYYSTKGIDLTMFSEGLNAIGYSSVLYFSADTKFYIITTLMVIFTAVISSIYPARKALKLNPATAIQQND